jgi:hypothetical protein
MTQRISVNCWTVTLEQDPQTGDLLLPLNDEMLGATGWQVGDTLVWELSTTESGPCAILTKSKENNNEHNPNIMGK